MVIFNVTLKMFNMLSLNFTFGKGSGKQTRDKRPERNDSEQDNVIQDDEENNLELVEQFGDIRGLLDGG